VLLGAVLCAAQGQLQQRFAAAGCYKA